MKGPRSQKLAGCSSQGAARVLVGALLFTASGAGVAHAQSAGSRLRLGVELGAGAMLTAYQRSSLKYDKDIQASITGGLALTGQTQLELTLRNWWFPSDLGYGRGTLIGVGVRQRFLRGASGAAFANGNLGLGRNGDISRFMFDGDARPRSSNKTAQGRSANRRMEFLIIDPPQAASNG